MNASPSSPTMSPSTQLSFTQWMEHARLNLSKENYLQLALTATLQLTDQLTNVASCKNFNNSLASFQGSSSSFNFNFDDEKKNEQSPPPRQSSSLTLDQLDIQLEDIKLENVILSIPTNTAGDNAPFEVRIQRPSNRDDFFGGIFDSPQLSSREVCFALGMLLLEMLNRECVDPLLMIGLGSGAKDGSDLGFASSLGDLARDTNNHNVDLDNLQLEDTNPRAFKKKSSFGANSISTTASNSSPCTNTTARISKAINAKSLLQAQGLPLSICQLVCDLLEAELGNPFLPDTALLSLEELNLELMLMISNPQRYLFDLTSCPRLALQYTGLFNQEVNNGEFYGRAQEMTQLMDIARTIYQKAASVSPQQQPLCEAIFLSASSGMGKSSLIQNFTRSLQANSTETAELFVITCQFQKDSPPLTVLLQTFNSFFERFVGGGGQRTFSLQATFDRMAYSIIKSIDNSECFGQLREVS